jgi:primosomal protein N' (replication factor Y)
MTPKASAAASSPELKGLWEVAVALPLFQTLTYRQPPGLQDQARVGCLVKVPVGRRETTGFLLGPAREVPAVPLKDLQAVLDPIPRFGPELVPLFRWLAEYYRYPLGEALRQLIPAGGRAPGLRQERWAALSAPPAAPPSRLGPRARTLLRHLEEAGPRPVRELEGFYPRCAPVLKRLAARGLVSLTARPAWRDPLAGHPAWSLEEPPPALVPGQEEARAAIVAGIARRAFSPFLLHGVTASGKTEVYLAAAQETLAQGRQVLVLLPEIALTHPVAQAFRQRFGDRVTLLHSGLTEAARLEQWRRIVLNQVDVVVGARSAVFAPLARPGLLVVDEEHDPAYKHEGGLPYQARDVALYRGQLAGAAVVLVSATPAVPTFYRAQEGKYGYLHLGQRVTPQALPAIHLIDLKEHRRGRGLPIITPPLARALSEVLARGEQALLFLNRRGYATVVFCLFCGQVFQCRHCSVALTQHRAQDLLTCHYCGYRQPLPAECPRCQSPAIKRYGVGTERVEAEVRQLFPQARVARLDRDTAPHTGRALTVLEDFARGRLDLLVGTQMITKGHHFPQVTLVGVIAADLSLFFPEYHAGERTFQLLSQVAGRAGRGETPGRVLIQTYHPEHYVFQMVQAQDYRGFYECELKARRQLGYPPFTRLALVRLSGAKEDTVAREAHRLAAALKQTVSRQAGLRDRVRVLGPAPAGLARLKGRWRWQLLLKSYGRPPLAETLAHLRNLWTPPRRTRLDFTIDIDAVSLF